MSDQTEYKITVTITAGVVPAVTGPEPEDYRIIGRQLEQHVAHAIEHLFEGRPDVEGWDANVRAEWTPEYPPIPDDGLCADPDCRGGLLMVEEGICWTLNVEGVDRAEDGTMSVVVYTDETHLDGAYTSGWECWNCGSQYRLPNGWDVDYVG